MRVKKFYGTLTISVFMILLTSVIIFVGRAITVSGTELRGEKLVTSVQVEEGDSLWSIASEYNKGAYSDLREYVSEIKETNNLESDKVSVGSYIVVPYFVE